jgi:ATP-dependent DNA helicase RecG
MRNNKPTLEELIENWETETVEFKSHLDGNEKQQTKRIGEYVSALSNEANLAETDCGWLILGVDNKTRTVIGNDFMVDQPNFNRMKQTIFTLTDGIISLSNVTEHFTEGGKRAVIIQIPAAPRGIPVGCSGHKYARAGESISPLPFSSEDAIRAQSANHDWSRGIVEDATIADLDQRAMLAARKGFSKRANKLELEDVLKWSDDEFLRKVNLMHPNGNLTRAALLLLGKPESSMLLSPNPARITWILDDKQRISEHFTIPFLLTSTDVFAKIRNYTYKITPVNTLIPAEIQKYSEWSVLEVLHNAIAHQEYRTNGRIIVTEKPDRIDIVSDGGFFEGQPEDYVLRGEIPAHYRNSLLADAMVRIGMIDTAGSGIKTLFEEQVRRYLPLPDYDLSDSNSVKVTIYGEPVDEAFSQILIKELGLEMSDVILLDKIQKHLEVPDNDIKRLKKMGLIEGRKPNIFISKSVSKLTGDEAKYLLNRGHENDYYKKLIVDYVTEFGEASRKQLDELLLFKLPELLTDDQKARKISKLLTELKEKDVIKNIGSRTVSKWVLFSFSEI